MSISRQQQRKASPYHGLHLVPDTDRTTASGLERSNFFYRIATVGAALFLAMTIC